MSRVRYAVPFLLLIALTWVFIRLGVNFAM
jgi:hypothetical protein